MFFSLPLNSMEFQSHQIEISSQQGGEGEGDLGVLPRIVLNLEMLTAAF